MCSEKSLPSREARYKYQHFVEEAVSQAIKPIYEDLTRDDLLERCLGAFNQNNNESFNQIIWKIAPKSACRRAVGCRRVVIWRRDCQIRVSNFNS